ncbi:MAG: aminotransferase class I/II-fold pyridoxal phosphate-dependent enzyme [Vulcanimicrobiaceae bacterium]
MTTVRSFAPPLAGASPAAAGGRAKTRERSVVIDPAIFDLPTASELAQRHSTKWTLHPPDVLPAFVAELDVPLAEPIAAALHAAIARGDTGYANPTALAEAFAAFALARYGWVVERAHCFAVPDVMAGVVEALRVLVEPGQGVAINTPVYPPFFAALDEARVRRIEVPLAHDATGTYDLDTDALEVAFAAGARAYLLCNPHNPVGRAFAPETLERVAGLAARYDVLVISDEIHAPLTLAGARATAFAPLATRAGARALAIVSASKAWNLAGLKCALAVASDDAVARAMLRMPREVRFRVGHLGAIAATVAFSEGVPWLDALCAHLTRNRDRLAGLLARDLPAVGFVAPDATYLAWLDCSRLHLGARPAATFLHDGRVALSPGTDFGTLGAGHVRLNFGTTRALLDEIVARMVRAVQVTSEPSTLSRMPSPPRSSA